MKEKARIDWHYEEKTDLAFGNGAYNIEKLLGWIACIIIPIFIGCELAGGWLHWSYLQIAVAFILAFDLGGGMICNSLNSCKRFYHSPLKSEEGRLESILKNHMLFCSLHIHPIIIGLLFGGINWAYGLLWYVGFMLSAFIVYRAPLYLKRPVAMLIILLAIMINLYILKPIAGFEWLIPVLFLKIIYGHLVPEEPYRK